MCTAVLSFDPDSPVPVLLAGVRDEYTDRAWLPPGRHWPDRPGLIGGLDLLAGGTWLAADPAERRVGCVLNGCGDAAPAEGRLSRGDLPLRAAATGGIGTLDLAHVDPFHLICAEPYNVKVWSWDGVNLTGTQVEPGLHLVVNSGLDGTGSGRSASIPRSGLAGMAARMGYFRPLFDQAVRPEPKLAGSTAEAWGEWLPILDGAGIPADDPRALLIRHDLPDRVFASTSVSLLALSAGGVRYDFTAAPGDPAAWSSVNQG
ncbi:MAG: NRDE family protein [Streptosporangiaceae bacterium]